MTTLTLPPHGSQLYLHSSHRADGTTWPGAPRDARHVVVPSHEEIAAQVPPIRRRLGEARAVVARSMLTIPLVLASIEADANVTLVLVEPALYDLVRGFTPTEERIGRMERAFADLDPDDLFPFWQRMRPELIGAPASASGWKRERPIAERVASRGAAWGRGITAASLGGRRVLVITGGWSDEFEQIAAALVEVGAEHIVLTGHDHRPEYHPRFPGIVSAFLGAESAATRPAILRSR